MLKPFFMRLFTNKIYFFILFSSLITIIFPYHIFSKSYENDIKINTKIYKYKELAEISYIQNDSASAVNYTSKLLEIGKSENDINIIVDAYNLYAMIYSYYDNKLAIKYINLAKKVSIKNSLKVEEGISDYYRGVIELNNNISEANKYFNKSLSIAKETNNINLTAISYLSIGEIFEYRGMQNTSLYYYLKSLEYFKKIVNKNISKIQIYYYGTLLNNLAISYKNIGKLNESFNYSIMANYYTKKINDEWGMASSYNNLGNISYRLNMPDTAFKYFAMALNIIEKYGSNSNIADIMINIGNCLSVQHKFNDAIIYYNKAKQLFINSNRIDGIVLSLINIADLYFNIGKYKKSLSIYQNANALAKNCNNITFMTDIYKGLYKYNSKMNNYRNALKYFRLYVQFKDSVFNLEKERDITSLEAKFKFEKKIADEKRHNEIMQAQIKEQTNRRNLLQYSGIFIFIIFMIVITFLTGKFRLKIRVAEGIIFITFILLFEFILVIIDPFTDRISMQTPLYKLVINFILALLIFPLHSYFEETLKRKIKRNK